MSDHNLESAGSLLHNATNPTLNNRYKERRAFYIMKRASLLLIPALALVIIGLAILFGMSRRNGISTAMTTGLTTDDIGRHIASTLPGTTAGTDVLNTTRVRGVAEVIEYNAEAIAMASTTAVPLTTTIASNDEFYLNDPKPSSDMNAEIKEYLEGTHYHIFPTHFGFKSKESKPRNLDMYGKLVDITNIFMYSILDPNGHPDLEKFKEELLTFVPKQHNDVTVKSVWFHTKDIYSLAIDCQVNGENLTFTRLNARPGSNIGLDALVDSEFEEKYFPKILFGFTTNKLNASSDAIMPFNSGWYVTASSPASSSKTYSVKEIRAILKGYLEAVCDLNDANLYISNKLDLDKLVCTSEQGTGEITSVMLPYLSTVVPALGDHDLVSFGSIEVESLKEIAKSLNNKKASTGDYSKFTAFLRDLEGISKLSDLRVMLKHTFITESGEHESPGTSHFKPIEYNPSVENNDAANNYY